MAQDWPDGRTLTTFQTFPPPQSHTNANGVATFSQEKDTPHLWNMTQEEDKDFVEKEEDLDIIINLLPDDKRFGFSVIGGFDEGFLPQVDGITSGSPADRANLEVGDEILEVNGRSLESASHQDVISHIHQCIRSRTICLRVKRRSGYKLADLTNNSSIQDAFVIAVEQQAKERLEKLSALQKIRPIDMTKLSELSDAPDINGVVENNSIFVASVPTNNTSLTNGLKSVNGDRHSWNNENWSSLDTPSSDLDTSTKESISPEDELMTLSPPLVKLNSITPESVYQAPDKSTDALLNHSGSQDSSDDNDNSSVTMSEIKHGLHREMAVDCPETFIGTAKAPPRYPPMKTPETTPVKKNKHDRNNVTPTSTLQKTSKEEQLERIRKYQEDLKKRKEQEEKLAKEEEFLRSSIRGSKKLQALESNPPNQGIPNTAFQSDDETDLTQEETFITESPPVKRVFAVEELFSALAHVQSKLRSEDDIEDLKSVAGILQSADFSKAFKIHNKVSEIWCYNAPPTPLCTDSEDLIHEVIKSLEESVWPEASELSDLLQKYEFEGLMFAHDKIAERSTFPELTAEEEMLQRGSQLTEEIVKIIKIDKTNEPLGATVLNEGESVIIGRIVKGGAAEKSGLLHEGDEILEVNGIDLRGKSVNDVCDILANMMGTITFLIVPSQDPRQTARDSVIHVKAHYNYDPEEDIYIPCRELGLSFVKGDILHVINQDDPNWWQAYREGEEDQSLAGLIPSKSFQQQREAMKQTIVGDAISKDNKKKGKFLCAKKNQKKKKKKVLYNANYNDEYDAEEILTYEEVALYYPRANRKRPVVLIGPPNVGRHELRQKLMESDIERFAAAVPHTSRPKKDQERDGYDYHFVPRQQFEADIVTRKFVEHGEYEKNYYGTSLEAIRAVVNSGKICVLNLHPQSLKILKASDLKPYVVFVAPPSLEKLRQLRAKAGIHVKDDELKEIIEKAREMEDSYGHYFDMIIINSDLDRVYNELLQEINRLEREPQWVPLEWIKNDVG